MPAAPARSLRFFFDFVSPYAYVAWKQMPALAARHGRALELVPVLFAAILDAHGSVGPAEIPAKRAYVFKDVVRKAHAAGLAPPVPPPAHPFNPLLALRAASLPMEEAARARLVDALFAATWGEGGGIESPEAVARAADRAGLEGEALVRRASEPDAKARLRAQTEAAIALGVFGVPTTVADEELFWGVDALPHLERWLEGRDPVPNDLLARWRDLPASASRKR